MRPFNMDDINPFFQICANPEVMRYFCAGKPLDQETVRSQITSWMNLYEQQGYGLLALNLKESHQLIGFCGLLHQTVDGEHFIELGYILPFLD